MSNIIILKIITDNFVPQDFISYGYLGCMIGFIIFVFLNIITNFTKKSIRGFSIFFSLTFIILTGLLFTPIGHKQVTTYWVYFPNPQTVHLYEEDYEISQDQNIYILVTKDTRKDCLKDTI